MGVRGLFGKVQAKVNDKMRTGLNRVMDEINSFEDRGGMRGAVERAKSRTEHNAKRIKEALEERGIRVEIGRVFPPTDDERRALRQHYRTLGVPFGADMKSVKAAYRTKMREHHPDHNAHSPEAEREATRITQELSIAYEAIEAHLKTP